MEVYVLWQRQTKSFKSYRPSFCTARMAKGSEDFSFQHYDRHPISQVPCVQYKQLSLPNRSKEGALWKKECFPLTG